MNSKINSGADQLDKRYSGMFSVIKIHASNLIYMSQSDYSRLKIDSMNGHVFLIHEEIALKKEAKVDEKLLPGQVMLSKKDYDDLDLPHKILLFRLHPLILEAILLREENSTLEQKLLLLCILIHMDNRQVMYKELLGHFNVDARAYDIEQIDEDELRGLITQLIEKKLVTLEAKYLPPVLYPVVIIDNKHHYADAIGIELEGLYSHFKNSELIDEYHVLMRKYSIVARKIMLFTIFTRRFFKRQSIDMGSCISAMQVKIRDSKNKHRLRPFTGLDSKLWDQIKPIRGEFLDELGRQDQANICMQFSLRLWEVRL